MIQLTTHHTESAAPHAIQCLFDGRFFDRTSHPWWADGRLQVHFFFVIELREPVFDALLDVRAANHADPKITCVHEGIALAKLKLDGGFSELTLIC